MKAINALYLEVDKSIADSIKDIALDVIKEQDDLAKERATGFADWIASFESLEKQGGFWFIESQIESIKLYDTFLAEKRKEGAK